MEGLDDLHLVDPSEDEDTVSNSSEDELQSDSSGSDEDEASSLEGLSVTEGDVLRNYEVLGTSVPADPPLHLLEDLRKKYPFAFTDHSESTLASVLKDNPLGFELSDFQVHIIFQPWSLKVIT